MRSSTQVGHSTERHDQRSTRATVPVSFGGPGGSPPLCLPFASPRLASGLVLTARCCGLKLFPSARPTSTNDCYLFRPKVDINYSNLDINSFRVTQLARGSTAIWQKTLLRRQRPPRQGEELRKQRRRRR